MVLDDAQRQKVQEWLIAHHPQHRVPDCGFCGNNAGQWIYTVYTMVMADWSPRPAPALPFRPRFDTVELECPTCGYLLSFRATPMGVVNYEAIDPESASAPPQ